MSKYAKAFAALISALFTILGVFGLTDAAGNVFGMSQETMLAVATPLVTMAATWLIPNKEP
jgi:hypothetical protein